MVKIIGKKAKDVIKFVAPYFSKDPTILEAGSFKGQDTLQLAQYWTSSLVHAFEPVPELFEELKLAVHRQDNVRCYKYALAHKTGDVVLYLAQKPNKPGIATQANCVLTPKERLKWSPFEYQEKIKVPGITLDDWAEKHGITHIDFMWLDLQGYELAVLKAGQKLLKNVKVLYCEVNFIEAYQGQPQFNEVNAWLKSNGFVLVAKDFKDEKSWFFGNGVWVKE